MFHGRDPTLEQGKCVGSPLPEEEGSADTMCNELTMTRITHLPALLCRGTKEIGSKVKPEEGGLGEGILKIRGYFSLSYSY